MPVIPREAQIAHFLRLLAIEVEAKRVVAFDNLRWGGGRVYHVEVLREGAADYKRLEFMVRETRPKTENESRQLSLF